MGETVTKTARLDLRITPDQKAMLDRVAKKKYRTLTSLLDEWIDWVALQEAKP